jgi:DNA-binding transcriptional ArsR family regulator
MQPGVRTHWGLRTLFSWLTTHRKANGLDFILLISKIPNMDKVFKALGDPTRRRILQLLREREMTAGELADCFQLAKPTLSGHFNVLREADLVVSEKSGTTITYRLNVSVLEEALLGFANLVGLGAPAVSRARRKLEKRHV